MRERDVYETYTAQALWTLAQGLYSMMNAEFNLPQYVEIVYPETVKKQPSAQQIKNGLVKQLLEG